MSSQLVTKLEKMGQGLDIFIDENSKTTRELFDRLESLESLQDRPEMSSGTKKSSEVKAATDKFFRTGDKSALSAYQPGFEDQVLELGSSKAMSIGTATAGGHTHVPELADQILAAVGSSVAMFADARHVSTDSNEFRQIYTVTSPTAARSAESGARSATDTPVITRRDVKLYDLYALATVSNELLDSSQFDISRYLAEEIERQFTATLEQEMATGAGTGSQQMLGILTQATSTSSDTDSPERSFDLYQRLALGTSSPISTFGYVQLVELMMAVPARYRRNSKFYASTDAIQTMRSFVDGSDMPKWLDSTGGINGQPQSIMGFPVEESSALPSVAYGNMPVIFGDMQQAYLIATHSRGMRVIRDDISTIGSTRFYFSLQIGGLPGDTRSLKALYVG
jgi:HK97 family phage major capsid protein